MRDRFAPRYYQALIRAGVKVFGGVKGSKTQYQLLPEDRYAGVNVHIDSDGNWHVTPAIEFQPTVILVVRRVDQRTAQITDHEGKPYSELMRIEDAIRILRELQT